MKSRRSMLGLVIAAVVGTFALLAPTKALAQDHQPGTIVGVVLNPDGKPVADAMVVLKHGDHVVARTHTGERGRFEFAKLRPGMYVVEAGKKDVGRAHARAEVSSGETTRVRLVLRKP